MKLKWDPTVLKVGSHFSFIVSRNQGEYRRQKKGDFSFLSTEAIFEMPLPNTGTVFHPFFAVLVTS